MKRLAIAAALCALCLGAAAVSAQADDACMQKGGRLDDAGKCMLTIDINVSVDYPLDLVQQYPFMEETIDSLIQSNRESFMQGVGSDFFPAPGPYELDITYETTQRGSDYLSLIFTVYDYGGGAHGSTVISTDTFYLVKEQAITLDDLFTNTADALAVIDPIVEEALTAQIGSDMVDLDWLKRGTGTDPQNYQAFALDDDSITFYFQQYQVAAYAVGIQTVTIPLSDLSGVLAPEFTS